MREQYQDTRLLSAMNKKSVFIVDGLARVTLSFLVAACIAIIPMENIQIYDWPWQALIMASIFPFLIFAHGIGIIARAKWSFWLMGKKIFNPVTFQYYQNQQE